MDPKSCEDDYYRCVRFAEQLKRGVIDFPEYAYNVTLCTVAHAAGRSPDVEGCANLVPGDRLESYAEYLRTFLLPVDFMPCPKPFLVCHSMKTVEEKKRELRPIYVSLLKVVELRLAKAMSRIVKSPGDSAAPARRAWMPTILKDVPAGHRWGSYSREDPRMHIQSVDRKYGYKVWLESKGQRVFEPEEKIPAKVLKAAKEVVSAKRQFIEDNWVDLMLDKGWLALHIALPRLTLVAYPNTPNKFTRVIDLTTWLTPEQFATLSPEIIELNRDMAALRLWTNRPEEQAYDVRLSRLLFGGEAGLR